jgi:ABC-type glycerol-3-phosphate transport system substrate-binding protein
MKKIIGIAASLVAVAGLAACGGDDGGSGNVDRDVLIAMFTEDGDMPQDIAECMADATIASLDEADMKLILDGGDPSAEGEAAFMEAIQPCLEMDMGS